MYRRIIWDFLIKTHKSSVDYRDFLHCMAELVRQGKLKNDGMGKYTVQDAVHREIFMT